MNTKISISAMSAAIALALSGCGGTSGSGGITGIGGSGFISSGSVSNFGSVFVNGVEFETDSASFDVDGASGSQDDLGIGMIVQVSGTINADGVTGTATSITFDDQVQGPVSGLSAPDNDGVKRSFTVLGVNVIIDSGSTTFDISIEDGIPASTVFDFDTIANANNVEISGFFDSSNNLIATRVELKDINFDALTDSVETRGTITGLINTSFSLNGLTIDAAAAVLEDLPNGLVEGQLVEVKGLYDGVSTITASRVEAEDDTVDDAAEIEVEGIITNYVADNNFVVNGISVDASSATREPTTLVLVNDVRVEVEGAIVNGILIADKVELRGGNAKIEATVDTVDAVAGTFEVIPVVGEPSITVTVTTSTRMKDSVNDIEPFTLVSLQTGDFVEIRGFEDGASSITATEVEVDDEDDVIVQATIQSGATPGTVKVLGVEFIIDYPAETDFENANDMAIDQTMFFNAVTLDSTLIKVRDKETVNGIADDIDIELP